MKGKDNFYFLLILVSGFFIGIFLVDEDFDQYAELITFLSIMVGFKITSLSILFNSVIKKSLYDQKNNSYETELHRLKSFYSHSLTFEVFAILILFLVPNYHEYNFSETVVIPFGRYRFILPILLGVSYCFYKILKDLMDIFSHPTND